nr:unnamed protein product [Callosobruchus chinensis]
MASVNYSPGDTSWTGTSVYTKGYTHKCR